MTRILLLTFLSLGLFACGSESASSDGGSGGDGGTAAGGEGGSGGGGGGTAGSGGSAGGGGQGGAGGGVDGSLVFVTSTVQTAALGGIAGADAICASQAADAGLEGDFRAWLSTLDSPVADRFVQSASPYVLVDGTRIADDWADLTDNFIQAPINLDAMGQPRGGDVWTATLPDGTSYTVDDCAGFTSASPVTMSLCGSSGSTFADWTATFTPTCSTSLRLYCFQQ